MSGLSGSDGSPPPLCGRARVSDQFARRATERYNLVPTGGILSRLQRRALIALLMLRRRDEQFALAVPEDLSSLSTVQERDPWRP